MRALKLNLDIMATNYIDINCVECFDEVKDWILNGKLPGVEHSPNKKEDEDSLCAVDDNGNYLWLYKDPSGCISAGRYGDNWGQNITDIINAIFGTNLVDDDSDEYNDFLEELNA